MQLPTLPAKGIIRDDKQFERTMELADVKGKKELVWNWIIS